MRYDVTKAHSNNFMYSGTRRNRTGKWKKNKKKKKTLTWLFIASFCLCILWQGFKSDFCKSYIRYILEHSCFIEALLGLIPVRPHFPIFSNSIKSPEALLWKWAISFIVCLALFQHPCTALGSAHSEVDKISITWSSETSKSSVFFADIWHCRTDSLSIK